MNCRYKQHFIPSNQHDVDGFLQLAEQWQMTRELCLLLVTVQDLRDVSSAGRQCQGTSCCVAEADICRSKQPWPEDPFHTGIESGRWLYFSHVTRGATQRLLFCIFSANFTDCYTAFTPIHQFRISPFLSS